MVLIKPSLKRFKLAYGQILTGILGGMAGVLELIGWPIFKGPQSRTSMYPLDPTAQELEVAKEILAEVGKQTKETELCCIFVKIIPFAF